VVPPTHRKICLVGAGNIARAHAAALQLIPGVELVAVCDRDPARASQFAADHMLPQAFGSLEDGIESGSFDFGHVLTPPDHHYEVAERLLTAGVGALVEKPLGITATETEQLAARAHAARVQLGVNHNALFFPAYARLRHQLAARAVGGLNHLVVTCNFTPQALRAPGHWMLRCPQNLIHESAGHPFSQIYDLAGSLISAEATATGHHDLGGGDHYFDTWQLSMVCERATAQLFLSFAGPYRSWNVTAVCEDGILSAEVERDRFTVSDRTHLGQYYEPLHLSLSKVRDELRDGFAGFRRETLGALRPVPRRDGYFTSMRDSISAFHRGPSANQPTADGWFGHHVTLFCEAATRSLPPQRVVMRDKPPSDRHRAWGSCDALVLGGTGFIGTDLVTRMIAAGMSVRVMSRRSSGLGAVFRHSDVQLMTGDIADADDLRRAVTGAQLVVHLAHGGDFTWAGVQKSMVDPTEQTARACLDNSVERLLYAGSIASLDLGDPTATLSGAARSDPRVGGPYGWGKTMSEALLQRCKELNSLPVTIVRPGIVLGAGATPFHSGFGLWKDAVHCLGWNQGLNPLPLVLVPDVSDAILLALASESAIGRTYNLAGDVRLCARECVRELRETLGRPLVFHSRHPAQHLGLQLSKWLVKAALGQPGARLPSYRSIKSLGCAATLDCSDAKRDLGWSPVRDRDEFSDHAFRVHGISRSLDQPGPSRERQPPSSESQKTA
jgi:predicted dehydrogenase/nucleoside-diphosphate-sugar epimerase